MIYVSQRLYDFQYHHRGHYLSKLWYRACSRAGMKAFIPSNCPETLRYKGMPKHFDTLLTSQAEVANEVLSAVARRENGPAASSLRQESRSNSPLVWELGVLHVVVMGKEYTIHDKAIAYEFIKTLALYLHLFGVREIAIRSVASAFSEKPKRKRRTLQ